MRYRPARHRQRRLRLRPKQSWQHWTKSRIRAIWTRSSARSIQSCFDAYNHCDLKTFDSLLADDVEFYHDQGGVTLGREKLTGSVKNNICTSDTQRVLVPGTLKVFYMKGYGAIEMGVHRFLHPKTEAANGTGEASFVQLWHYKDGTWKLTRVLSYDHHSAQARKN